MGVTCPSITFCATPIGSPSASTQTPFCPAFKKQVLPCSPSLPRAVSASLLCPHLDGWSRPTSGAANALEERS